VPRKENRFVKLRTAVGFSAAEMADLFGVNQTTWYRWEASGDETKIDPLHRKILEYMTMRLGGRPVMSIQDVRQQLAVGGTLRGLAALLQPLLERA
jgi:hypothetical protein